MIELAVPLIMLALIMVASIIDFKTKSVPSALLTSLIIIPLALNVGLGYTQNIFFGILAFAFAYLLFDLDFFGGIGDVKVMTALGFLCGSMYQVAFLVLLTGIFGIAWKGLWVWRYNKKKQELPDEFPFIPVFVYVYLVMIMTGGLF
jgi:Flp pilus assembly protein protease CpaA